MGKKITFDSMISPIANSRSPQSRLSDAASKRSVRFDLRQYDKPRNSSNKRSKSNKRLRDNISIERVSDPHRNDFKMFKPNIKVR